MPIMWCRGVFPLLTCSEIVPKVQVKIVGLAKAAMIATVFSIMK